MRKFLKEGEYLEDLQRNNMKIIQSRRHYRFSMDAVLLAHFVNLTRASARVIDLGTGSGVISLLISALYPEAKITGIELQDQLADMAERNIMINSLQDKVNIVKGDIKEINKFEKSCSADVVVSNPPYIPRNAGKQSSNRAVAAAKQEIECELKDIIYAANYLLKGRGSFFIVYRPERLIDLCYLVRLYDLEPKDIRFVFSKEDQKSNLVLLKCVKNSSSGVSVLPPLIVMNEKGEYTKEVFEMYYGKRSN